MSQSLGVTHPKDGLSNAERRLVSSSAKAMVERQPPRSPVILPAAKVVSTAVSIASAAAMQALLLRLVPSQRNSRAVDRMMPAGLAMPLPRSEEHTSELQSLMRI